MEIKKQNVAKSMVYISCVCIEWNKKKISIFFGKDEIRLSSDSLSIKYYTISK